MWSAIDAFSRKRSGTVVSLPNQSPMRFERSPESDLPKELKQMGYAIRSNGTTERLLPDVEALTQHGRPASEKVERTRVGLAHVQIYELDIPQYREREGPPRKPRTQPGY